MAAPGNEIELLSGGTQQDNEKREGWAQNLWKIRDTISVRPGWGQVAELDTTLGMDIKATNAGARFESTSYGYKKLLGSHYIETSFGNKQIISIFLARANSGNTFGEPKEFRWDFYLVARIFDLTTNRHWEEVFHRHTSERVLGGDLLGNIFSTADIQPSLPSTWYGCYESSYDVDNSSFIAGRNEPEWFFQVYQNNLYFGAPSQGVYMYQPVDFKNLRRQQLEVDAEFDWVSGYSESTLIKRLDFSPGLFRDGFVYVESSALTKIQSACIFRGRMAFATEHEIFFSDPGKPANIIASNFIICPSANKITAIAELRGNLIIFTENETYLYIPSEGTIVSRGRPPINTSNNIGCVGPASIQLADNRLIWVSHTGVHSTSDGSSIRELSANIKSFWKSGGLMTNPMTSYFESALAPDAAKGHVNITGVTPPRTLIQFDPDGVTLAYAESSKTLLMGVPKLNGAWCFSYNMWSWWPFESVASENGGVPIVETVSNLINPRVLSSNTAFYSVCGVNEDTMTNNALAHLDGNATGLAANSIGSNFVITKLGYGGALDRSCVDEDQRLGSGKYIAVSKGGASSRDYRFYFRPFKPEVTATNTIYWAPLELVPPQASGAWNNNLVAYSLHFKFDNTQWSCNSSGAGVITPRISNERLKSHSNAALVVIETDVVGAAAVPGGGYIKITWTGSAVPGGTYINQPRLNVAPRSSNPLIELPFTPISLANSQAGLGILMVTSSVTDSAANSISALPVLAWTGMVVGTNNKHISNAKVQSVDWAYKGKEISDTAKQLRARGIYARIQSTGHGTTRIVPNWAWGVYNILLGSDNKGYTTQVVDYDNDIKTIQDKLTIRSRFRDSSSEMAGRVFGNAASNPKWGSAATATHGDYLIDDAQTDTIATSDSVKGETISYMVFGFIRNRAASLTLESLKGVFRRAGGRRRTGR